MGRATFLIDLEDKAEKVGVEGRGPGNSPRCTQEYSFGGTHCPRLVLQENREIVHFLLRSVFSSL